MMENTFVQNQCLSCGGAIENPEYKNCPHCGTLLDEVQAKINQRNKNIELCHNCGSPVTYNIEKQQFSCDYCHSTFTPQSEKDLDRVVFEADNLIPFQVPKGLAKKRFFEWLIKGNNVPNDILDRMDNIQLEQVYVPYMGANIVYEGSWGAEIGYNRSETYTHYETREGKKGEKYSEPVTRTRTVVDWNHHSDVFSGHTHKSFLVNSELKGSVAEFMKKVGDLIFSADTKPFDQHYTAGTRQLKISPDKVSESLRSVRDIAQEEANKTVLRLLPGDKKKNATVTKLSYKLTSHYTYVPFWKITYKYEGVDYIVLVTAAKNEKIELDGSKPVSQNDTKIEKRMILSGRIGLLASVFGFLMTLFDVIPNAGPFWAVVVAAGIIVWIFFAIKRALFHRGNRKNLKKILAEHQEYLELSNKYPQ
ncbi:zinc ribbon domain-containing protein [Enterococcus sp. BWR-S5]|uniref:zinc ribbon domain-containing protein n=1 Tax=Enterococcus sp. BWR-S5 TaxID=2787714 RepID=UPI001922110C|nr:zinc ribbon domain-containing protein [Enterococcus sp. BWR-S5]